MTNYEKLQDEVAYGFRKLHGRCGVYINRPISPIGCIIKLLQLFFNKDINRKVFIATNTDIESNELREVIKSVFPNYFVSVTTKRYVKDFRFLEYDLVITLNIDDNNELYNLIHNDSVKFYLAIFDRRDLKDKNLTKREGLISFINTTVSANKIIEDCIHSPVKGTMIGVDLTDDEAVKYKEHNNFVIESMKIFGNFETLERARSGDKTMNYSPAYVCSVIARNNGWNEEIDTTTEYGANLDTIYNPNSIHERACKVFLHTSARKNIVVNTETKLIEIANIVSDNRDKKIIIVSANGEFANKITDYLNKMIETPDGGYIEICGNYHNEIKDKVYIDKKGNTVLYKSGEKKGQPKVIGYQKQSTLAMEDFNNGYIDVLSIKATSDANLYADCDIVIFTSPLIGSIYDIRRRFQNVMFRSKPLELFVIYCRNTTEQVAVDKYETTPIFEIIRDEDNFYVSD